MDRRSGCGHDRAGDPHVLSREPLGVKGSAPQRFCVQRRGVHVGVSEPLISSRRTPGSRFNGSPTSGFSVPLPSRERRPSSTTAGAAEYARAAGTHRALAPPAVRASQRAAARHSTPPSTLNALRSRSAQPVRAAPASRGDSRRSARSRPSCRARRSSRVSRCLRGRCSRAARPGGAGRGRLG